MKKLYLILFTFLCVAQGYSKTTKGKEFWIAYMENLSMSFNGPPVFKIHVTADVSTTFTVSIPSIAYSSVCVIGANQVNVFSLPALNYNPMGDEAIANNGIVILSNDSIEVVAFHHRVNFTESTRVFPVSDLGTSYLVTATTDGLGSGPAEFVVLATKNNTTIEITPTAVTIGSRPIGIPFTVVLQRGQMYQIQALGDLSGTSVKSLGLNSKIAVFGGSRQATLGCTLGSADDHIYDQVFPISSLGAFYNIVPFSGHTVDVVKIIASLNNTTINVSGMPPFVLNQGQVNTFTISSSCDITSSSPISVSHLASSATCNAPTQGTMTNTYGDAGLINLPSAELTLKKSVFYTPTAVKLGATYETYDLHRVNIVIKTSAIGNLRLDNVSIPSSSFSPVTSSSNYSYARLILDTLTILQHTLTCDSGFSACIYTFPYVSFYGHHLGFNTLDVLPNLLGIQSNYQNASDVLFPNPVANTLEIRSSSPIVFVEIKNMLGTTLMNTSANYDLDFQIDVRSLPTGIYYCVIHYQEKKTPCKSLKFVKEEIK